MKKIEVKMEPNGLEMDVNRQEFALALKTWRLRRGLTQKQVGDAWDVSRWTIMRAESARDVTWETAYRLLVRLVQELRKEGEI